MSTWPSGNVPTTHVDESTDDPTLARANILTAFERINAILESRGMNDGVASLGTTGGVPRSQLGLVLSTTGGTLTGPLTLPGNPTNTLHAATRLYVDNMVFATANYGTHSITNSKILPGTIASDKLSSATGSVIVAGSFLQATMNAYGFFPSIVTTGTGGFGGGAGNTDSAISTADDGSSTPRIKIWAAGGSSTTMRWRYIAATDNPEIWIIWNDQTGMMLGVWVSDDALDSPEPPIATDGQTALRFTANDLAALNLPSTEMKEAEKRIKARNMKREHTPFRALQEHAQDPAPAKWLLENTKIVGSRLVRK